jgi:hypothetical protein
VIALAVVVMLVFVLRMLLPVMAGRGELRGDGQHVDTYGFDLSTCLIPLEQITPAVPKDLIKALDHPATLPGSELDAYNQEQRQRYHRKFIVSSDRVAGVVVNGAARAYPLNVMCWHEVCNDTLGGEPVCISFSPLCDSVVVFSRKVAGEELSFGSSGLLYNSNLLMYDKHDGGAGESLWSQLGLRAVAGPYAKQAAQLTLLPVEVTRWADWQLRHPETTVALGLADYGDRYNMNPYGLYLAEGKPKYPINPPPAADGPDPFSRVLAVKAGESWRVYSFTRIAMAAAQEGVWRDGGIAFYYDPETAAMSPEVAYITSEEAAAETSGVSVASLTSLWFAWQAQYPGVAPPAY